jgi:hypothetical protein
MRGSSVSRNAAAAITSAPQRSVLMQVITAKFSACVFSSADTRRKAASTRSMPKPMAACSSSSAYQIARLRPRVAASPQGRPPASGQARASVRMVNAL